jgi:hypothetical protein
VASLVLAPAPSTVVAAYRDADDVLATRTCQIRSGWHRGLGWVVATHPATTYPEGDSILASSSHRHVREQPTAAVPVKCPPANTGLQRAGAMYAGPSGLSRLLTGLH